MKLVKEIISPPKKENEKKPDGEKESHELQEK